MLDKTHLKRPKDHSLCLDINNNHKKSFFYNTVKTCFDLPRNIIDYIYVLFPLTDWRWPRTTTKSRTINRVVENVSNSETSSYTVCVAIFVHVRRLTQWFMIVDVLVGSLCLFHQRVKNTKRQRQGGSRQRSFIVLPHCKVGGGPEMIPQTHLNRQTTRKTVKTPSND